MADDTSTDLEQQAKDAILKEIVKRAPGSNPGPLKELAEAWSLVCGDMVATFDPDDE